MSCASISVLWKHVGRLRNSHGIKMKKKQGQTNITWETQQTAGIQNDRMWMTETRICYYQSTNGQQAGLASYHNVTNAVLSFWSWVCHGVE